MDKNNQYNSVFISDVHLGFLGCKAEKLYELFIDELKKYNINLQSGKFGANMSVKLINNGPVTFWLDSNE